MNTPSDELFRVVKSLQSHEKRLFKQSSQQNSQNSDYVRLFDAVDSLEEYDEKRLILILNRKKKIANLAFIKNYLLEALFTFLENYYFDYSVDIRLQKLLHRIEILFSKKLFVSAHKCLKKTERIAMENHRFLALLSIMSWKHKIIVCEATDSVSLDKFNEEKYKSEIYYIDLYKNDIEYQKIKLDVIRNLVSSNQSINKKENIEELKKLIKTQGLKSEDLALSIPAKYNYCYALAMAYLQLDKKDKSYLYFNRVIGYFDQAKKGYSERLVVYTRFMMLLCDLKINIEIENLKEEVEKIINSIPNKERTKHIEGIYLAFMNNYIDHQLTTCNFEKALLAGGEMPRKLEEFPSMESFMIYYANRFLIYFILADFRRALRCANKVLLLESTGAIGNIVFQMRIFSLITQYELGNMEMLKTLLKSVVRKYNKELRQNKIENLIVSFLGKTVHENPSKEKLIMSFKQLKGALRLIKNRNKPHQFDFISWVESKIEYRPMADIMREKVKP